MFWLRNTTAEAFLASTKFDQIGGAFDWLRQMSVDHAPKLSDVYATAPLKFTQILLYLLNGEMEIKFSHSFYEFAFV
jgi:hypothetical protein